MPPDGRPSAPLCDAPPAGAGQPQHVKHATDGQAHQHARCLGLRLVATGSCMRDDTHGAGSGPPTIEAKRTTVGRLPHRATQALRATGVVCAHRRSRDEAGRQDRQWGRARWLVISLLFVDVLPRLSFPPPEGTTVAGLRKCLFVV